MPSITSIANTPARNARVNQVKSKIRNISNLAASTALTAVENKIPNFRDLAKKTEYNTRFSGIENKILLLLIMIMINILLLMNLIS